MPGAVIASVGRDIRTYADSGLLSGKTYCYRVTAFNSSGVSSPSEESCATIPTSFNLSLTKSGTGGGSLHSAPAGINCGSDCSEAYVSGTVVTLTAVPATGSWTLNGDGQWKNCTVEKCAKSFGALGDRPVAGDWTGNGIAKIGLYRPATGE